MSDFTNKMKQRRSYREYSNERIPLEVIIEAVEAAKHAPSGANMQPWTFCIVKDQELKREIRIKAEEIEQNFYKKINEEWKHDLEPLSVDATKGFLEEAQYLIVIFKHKYQLNEDGSKRKVYYPDISVGLASGILLSALTDLNVQTLTYTPSPNHFLQELLNRPENEKPYLMIVCGRGSENYVLPNIGKKSNDDVIKIY